MSKYTLRRKRYDPRWAYGHPRGSKRCMQRFFLLTGISFCQVTFTAAAVPRPFSVTFLVTFFGFRCDSYRLQPAIKSSRDVFAPREAIMPCSDDSIVHSSVNPVLFGFFGTIKLHGLYPG